MSLSISVQVFTGGFGKGLSKLGEIKERLDYLHNYLPIKNVIAGWNIDSDLYLRLADFLHRKGIRLFLWYPTLAELDFLGSFSPVIRWDKNPAEGYALGDHERFLFACPNNDKNIDLVIELFEKNFANIGFDGVFLDRIRYPAFSNGIHSIFTCFCSKCVELMEDSGINTGLLIERLNNYFSKSCVDPGNEIFKIKNRDKLTYIFEDDLWNDFFRFKSKSIYSAVNRLYSYFSKKGMQVGLDLFAPFISFFIGQDPALLCKCCDFIKPMIYRRVWAPAGMPFEFHKWTKDLREKERLSISRALGNIPCFEYNIDQEISCDFALKELKGLCDKCNDIPVYAGVEVHRKEHARIYPEDVVRNLQVVFSSKAQGIVLSSNVMAAPEDNLETFIKTVLSRAGT